MKRCLLSLLFLSVLWLASASIAWAAAPVIQYVSLERGQDREPKLGADYHQRVLVWVSDDDGAADIQSVVITDPGQHEYTITPSDSGEIEAWYQEDDFTIMAYLWACDQREALGAGSYHIEATDASPNTDIFDTPAVPAVREVYPVPVSPPPDAVIGETVVTFECTILGIPPAYYQVWLQEEGSWDLLWYADLGEVSGETISVSCPLELEPGRSHLWGADAVWLEESSDPRVGIVTRQRLFTRFTVYGDWPATPLALPGKLAYTQYYHPVWGGRPAIMQYDNSPLERIWLTSDYCQTPDWSPDGTHLLYYQTGPSPPGVAIDALDGSPPVWIPGSSSWYDARWVPDGRRIVYATGGDIWVAYADGSQDPYPLVASEYSERYPRWSPDGVWIAYGRAPAPDGDALRLVRDDGTEDHPVVPTGVAGYPDYTVTWFGWEHAWSPAANALAVGFCACGPEGTPMRAIGTISCDGGPVTPVFIAPPDIVCCAQPRLPEWSPEATQIVFSSGHHLAPDPDWVKGKFEPGVELWVVTADGSGELERLTYDYSWDGSVSWWGVDTTPPVIVITSPTQGAEYPFGSGITFSFSATDLCSQPTVVADVDGQTVSPGDVRSDLAVGDHTLTVTATDAAGNSATQSVTFKVVNTVARLTVAGWIELANKKGTAGFTAQQQAGAPAPTGNVHYMDHDTGMKVDAIALTGLGVAGNQAWLAGLCTIDGLAGHSFLIHVIDGGQGGQGDFFEITLDTGYHAGEMLGGGNVTIQQ